MQRSISPARAELLRQFFHFRKRRFRERSLRILKRRIAEIDPASDRAMRSRGAQTIHLKRAPVTRDRLREWQFGLEQDLRLELTHEKRMTVLREAAAAARGIALRCRLRNSGIHLRVNGQQLLTQASIHPVSISRIEFIEVAYNSFMKLCISQVCTLPASFAEDLQGYAEGGCTTVEVWLTKLEQYLKIHSLENTKALLAEHGVELVAAAYQGGLLLSQGEARQVSFEHYRRRLDLCQQFRIPTLLLVADFANQLDDTMLGRAIVSLKQAAQWAAAFDVTLGLEFRGADAFCNNLETALLLVEQADEANLGVCLDTFHFHKGPSKSEDLRKITKSNLAHVQVCDVPGVPRELMTDSDRVFPGEGDFILSPLIEHLKKIEYDRGVSLEVMNPIVWNSKPSQVAELGLTALRRTVL